MVVYIRSCGSIMGYIDIDSRAIILQFSDSIDNLGLYRYELFGDLCEYYGVNL